jgi:hypothetical protein
LAMDSATKTPEHFGFRANVVKFVTIVPASRGDSGINVTLCNYAKA